MQANYQLTRHPVGSIKEIWAISWPLMLGLISNSLMMFCDRLLLSWHSPLALNACANGGMAYYLFTALPLCICTISEVLVGRLHGDGRWTEIGKPVWQMVWFALSMTPLYFAIGWGLPGILFYQTGNEACETAYFQSLMAFAPMLCCTIALSGFFIGIGNVSIVTICAIFGNAANVFIAFALIFGLGPIPSLGIQGAALATGIAQTLQVLLLLWFFLGKKNRETYGTAQFGFNFPYLKEGLSIGIPSGSGHAVEVLAHFAFFRIIMLSGNESMTIVSLVQSFYILLAFIIDAVSKGVGAIAANLIGANQFSLVRPVVLSAVKLHFLFFLVFFSFFIVAPQYWIGLFFNEGNNSLLDYSLFMESAIQAALWMLLFFLFDGFCWILIGLLTAAGDTKFIFWVSSVINWVGYVFPAYLLLGLGQKGADIGWMIIALSSVLNFMIYFWRYRSGAWLKSLPTAENLA